MLLPDNRIELIERLFRSSIPKLMVGPRTEGVGGNAALYRDVQNGLSGRHATTKTTFDRLLDYWVSNGIGGNPDQEFTSTARAKLANDIQQVGNAGVVTFHPDNGGPFAAAMTRLKEADRDVRRQVGTRDIEAVRFRLDTLDFAGAGLVQQVIDELGALNDPSRLPSFLAPLRILTELWILAFIETAYFGDRKDRLSSLVPRLDETGGIVRPMTRWMRVLKHVLDVETQSAASRIVGAGNDPVQDMKAYWAGKVPGDQKFRSIITQAHEHLRRQGDNEDAQSLIDLLDEHVPSVKCFETMLRESEMIESKIIKSGLEWYDSLSPFIDYTFLMDRAHTIGASAP